MINKHLKYIFHKGGGNLYIACRRFFTPDIYNAYADTSFHQLGLPLGHRSRARGAMRQDHDPHALPARIASLSLDL